MAKGNFIEYVVSDNPNKYPNDGEQGGYYYEVFDGSGAYVWKKYPLVDTTVSNPTITLNGIATNPTLSSQDINLDLADESTFGGFLSTSNPTGYYFKYENAKLYYVDPDGQYEATYDQTTHKLSIPTCPSTGSHNNAAFKYTGNKVVKILGEPEFVVSDDSNAYPDGAVHTDGYYYERFVGELTPEMFGCTKVAIDTVTFASDQHFLSNGVEYYLPHFFLCQTPVGNHK